VTGGRAGRVAPLAALLVAVVALRGCAGNRQPGRSVVEPGAPAPVAADAAQLGGPATVDDAGIHAFGYPAPVLTARERRVFAVGKAFFEDNWVTAPASTEGRDGLGPLFNARSCSSCHLRDGRGRPPRPGERAPSGLLLRLGVAGGEGGDAPHPVYGGQLQDRAILGVEPEAGFRIRLEPIPGRFADGSAYELLAPRYEIVDPRYGPVGADLRVGPRVAPQLVGLGLLEAVPEAAILARADPGDADRDGISGRAHSVASRRHGRPRLGRFGWKATRPSLEEQIAAAFVHDIGITSSLFRDEILSDPERAAIRFVSGGDPELADPKLERITFYCQTLAVPAQRRAQDEEVRRGRALFGALGCESCHTPELTTGDGAAVGALRNQVFRPYTDLLLHDMGEPLADGKRDGDATPREWRTPPLWGIGLIERVSGHTRYLHDGRARDLREAVLWHGGEAQRARDAFRRLSAEDRRAVVAFLRSL
jgi:CxxC motif-containing protein (DUF1111 family)